ncbi:hypothetical protein FRC02_000360 [Tulasnella sp. 418]|nr:hypothetical protein FRC02_000360 [Tulasnella sp. 418]
MATSLTEIYNHWKTSVTALHGSITSFQAYSLALAAALDRTLVTHDPHCRRNDDISLIEKIGFDIDDQLKTQNIADMDQQIEPSKRLLARVRNTSSKLSPASILPPEVLSHIVVLGHEDEEERHRQRLRQRQLEHFDAELDDFLNRPGRVDPTYKPPIHFPTLFSHVCQRWRNVALSVSTLWSTIDGRKGTEQAHEYLLRSKISPLTLILRPGKDDTYTASSLKTDPVFGILSSNIHRVSSLDIEVEHLEDVETVMNVLGEAGSGTHLGTLRFFLANSWGDVISTTVSQDFCHRIQKLSLTGAHFPWDSMAYTGLTWFKLTNISRALNASQMLAILHTSPLLEGLILEYVVINSPSDEHYAPVLLKNLQTLNIAQLPVNLVEFETANRWLRSNNFLFSILDTPNLISLNIYGLRIIPPHFTEFIKRLMPREEPRGTLLGSKLSVLRLSTCGLPPSTIRFLLASLPNIAASTQQDAVFPLHLCSRTLCKVDWSRTIARMLYKSRSCSSIVVLLAISSQH